MDRAEFAINYETSSDLFGNNQIIDFKTALPIQNHRSPYTSLSIKNILCEITSDNIIQQSSPTILWVVWGVELICFLQIGLGRSAGRVNTPGCIGLISTG